MRRTLLFSTLLATAACSTPSTPAPADVPTIFVGDLGPDGASDASADTTAPTDTARPPYDAGPAPACALAAFTRHVMDQSAGVNVIEAGGLVETASGFVFAVRQGASRLSMPDGSPPRRDTVDTMAVSPLGFATSPLTTLYDSTAAGSDLSPPTLVRAGASPLALWRENVGVQGMTASFSTRVRGAVLTANATTTGAPIVIEDRGDPFAAALPGGDVLMVSPRIVSRDDAGLIAVAPNVVRVSASGMVQSARGVDLTSLVPVNADSVMMLPAPDGAALVFRVATELRVLRFDREGVVDTRVRVTRNLDATRLDDGAIFDEGVVLAWDEPSGQNHSIHVAVVDPDGALVNDTVVERYTAPGSPVVNVAKVWGGASVVWVRGSGDSAVLRGLVVQPDGIPRTPPRDLLPVPGADGRLYTAGNGRALTFIARDRTAAGFGVTFGRTCLPE